MMQRSVIAISCFFFLLNHFAFGQVELLDDERLKQMIKYHDLKKVIVNLNGTLFNPSIHKVGLQKLAPKRNYHLMYKDEQGRFYLKKGTYQINIYLDTIHPVAFTQSVVVNTTDQQFSFSMDTILAPIDLSQSWLDYINADDSIIVVQLNDNNWLTNKDTIHLRWDGTQPLMDWTCHRKGGKIDTTFAKTQILDPSLVDAFKAIEGKLQYPLGIHKMRFESCGNCRGNQSVIMIYYRNYQLYFWEPKCRNGYWYAFRKLFFGNEG